MIQKLEPLQKRLGPPKPGDWLSIHQEDGQTFQEYLDYDPVLPKGKRRVLYLQPLGAFTADQRKIVGLTTEFMGLYFGLQVKTLGDLPLTVIPSSARRTLPGGKGPQILTRFVLKKILKPRLPKDGAALVALTASDLYPRESWQFVFGEASISERVGVWSIHRLGDPSDDIKSFRLCLVRAIATATHETGHMFSMLHCTKFLCNMNGSESLEESDQQPLALCPECLAKLCWATGIEPKDHLRKLMDFCERNGLHVEAISYRKSLRALNAMNLKSMAQK